MVTQMVASIKMPTSAWSVPAPAGTFEVYGKDHDGELHWLGTEFKGATNPDWVEEFKHTLDVIDRRRE